MMVHHLRKQDSGEFLHRIKAKPTLLLGHFIVLSTFSLTFMFFVFFLFPSSLILCNEEDAQRESQQQQTQPPPCSWVPNNTICCDRTSIRTDVCFMKGDIRTSSISHTIFLVNNMLPAVLNEEKIKPYTRKWEKKTMATIDELRLRPTTNKTSPCDVAHDVPAVFFSTGGYTGNVYHEFNDGIIPLYITSHKFVRKVVFVILEYHDWWITKYENILTKLSDFPPIDFANDKRTHCFPEAIMGLEIHDELSIDSKRMAKNTTVRDFRQVIDESYKPRINWILKEEKLITSKQQQQKQQHRPKLVIISRNGSRGIENQDELVRLAEKIGFLVTVLQPTKTTELAKIYRALNSSDVMIGVHGAAMTHFLFMRPGSVFIQIVPLGTDWAAESYYGAPAEKLGLKYIKYGIMPKESSLYREYEKDDPVLTDPDSVNAKGWEVTKRVYLDGQNVRLDLGRVRKRLVKAIEYIGSMGKSRKDLIDEQRRLS